MYNESTKGLVLHRSSLRSIDFYLFILLRKHSISTVNASISVIKIPLGKQARSLFCVFLPPSSNEIQLQLHAIYLRHHKRGAPCATFRFLLRIQRESRMLAVSKAKSRKCRWRYNPPIRRQLSACAARCSGIAPWREKAGTLHQGSTL